MRSDKMITLLQLKNRKADLRNMMIAERKTMGAVSEKTFNKYEAVTCHLIFAESKLLKPVDKCTRCRHLHE